MSTVISPNMSLVIPGVGTQDGPQYATDVNNSLTIIDQHDHSAGNGVLITPSGININSALSINGYSLTLVGAATFQAVILDAAADSLYVKGVDLYYKDGSSNVIRITQSGSVSGASGTITGLPSGTASAAYAAGTFVFQSATNTAANIDGGSFILRNATANSKGLTLQPPNAMAADYALTLPSIPAQTNVMTLDASGNMGSITYDAVGSAMTSVGANAIGASMNSTGANAVANTRTRSVGTTVAAGGVAISASCGVFSTSSVTYVPVTNLSVTITTTGRPVRLSIEPAKSNTVFSITGSTGAISQLRFLRDSTTTVGVGTWSHNTGVLLVSPFLGSTDAVAAGTYTYIIQMLDGLSVGATLSNAVLVAYEL